MLRIVLSFFIVSFCSLICFGQIDIADARASDLGTTVTVEGIVTNGSELGIIRYMQDATGAIAVYPGTGSVGDFPSDVARGDIISVTGELKEFNGLLEIDPISAYEVISSNNSLPNPREITPAEVSEEIEAELVILRDIKFTAGGATFSVGNYEIVSGSESSEIYVRSNHPMIGEEIPLATVHLTGLGSQFNSIYQILPRGIEDIEIADNFFLTESPKQSNISTSGFTVTWQTNEAGSSIVRYGTTPAMEEMIEMNNSTTDHSIDLSGLEAATFYYVEVSSSNGTSEAISQQKIYSTASNSSGNIKIYFTDEVNGDFSNGNYATGTTGAAIEAEIISKIENAKTSIDAAIYNINRKTIVQALTEAHDRGVTVRYIADNETANLALMDPTPPFPIIRGNSDGLMHNKFFVFDAEDNDNSWVMTGSTNMTEQNIAQDFNNTVFIQDQALAKAYTIEFQEMWGTDTATPGVFTVLFGPDKLDNTPHQFLINDILVESYFSPSDNTTIGIANAIKSAENDIQFALLTFTNNELGDAILDAHNSGIEVRGIIDNINDQGSEFDYLSSNGVNVTPDNNTKSTHHKYCIIDANGSNPKVVLGSHNWSGGAETRNDENTLIFHDEDINNIFLQEFEARWCEVQNGAECTTSVEDNEIEGLTITSFPNPTTDYVNLRLELEDQQSDFVIKLLNANGKVLQASVLNNINGVYNQQIDMRNYSTGQYILQVSNGEKSNSSLVQLID